MKTCADCKYFQSFGDPKDQMGECFRYPPTVFLMQQVVKKSQLDPTPVIVTNRATYYPVVQNQSRECGDFKTMLQSIT